LHDAQLDEIDIEGVLGFAETLILDARRLWMEGTLDQRQRLQKVLFPKGVSYSNQSGFGTTETILFFRWLALVQEKNEVWRPRRDLNPCYRRERRKLGCWKDREFS
jgi:hypothetical protein